MPGRCFITAAGKFFPGEPVNNDGIEQRLGQVGSKPSVLREKILGQNGIQQRYYAIDEMQRTSVSNAEMAARAVRDAVSHSRIGLKDIQLLSAATSAGDLPLPGFASMVHGLLDIPPCGIATLHGICASSVLALKHAAMAVSSGEVSVASCVASEFPSRLLKASRYQMQGYGSGKKLPFENEFLRWMLSDGAAALILQDQPDTSRLSLEVQWIEVKSYASQYPPCMFVGNKVEVNSPEGQGWLDYPDYESASAAGAINLHQTVELLESVVQRCVSGVFELIEAGRLDPQSIDWWASHYSSQIFRRQALELLRRGGLPLVEERVFSNLSARGNIGSAAFPSMIEELLNNGSLKPGQRIFCIVPESGRFLFTYVLLKVVGEGGMAEKPSTRATLSEPPDIKTSGTPIEESLVRQLSQVWTDFEVRLNEAPVIEKMNQGRLTLQDYRDLLFNLRQQVIDGSRWISRAASNLTTEFFPIRSAFISHSSDEHRDFQMIERDYASVGGSLEEIQAGQKNIGSTALSEYILSRASRENPFDLIGAMFIIEGLGRRVARRWAERIRDQLHLEDWQVSFLMYHSSSDDVHFQRLDAAVQSGMLTEQRVADIVKAAKVVARLYILQLEEIGNF